MKGHSSVMEAFIVREGEMVVFNAHDHAFADEVQNAVIQLQVLEDDAYQDVVTPMVKQVQRGTHVEHACKFPIFVNYQT